MSAKLQVLTDSQPLASEATDSDSSAPEAEDRYQRIAELAYVKALQRGFEPGHELDDWLEAEKEIAGYAPGQPQP
ncbi:MAG: DUF2934 domain-containing protein [Chromatiaceae bacterium]|nr:MAG: DUF2934 domain-containing protein [Chromatiaceae bacterium]